jgi:hypothetical protein
MRKFSRWHRNQPGYKKSPTPQGAGLFCSDVEITSSREQQVQQPEQRRPGPQPPERQLRRAWRLQPGRQRGQPLVRELQQRGPERRQEPVPGREQLLLFYRKRKQPEPAEQQRGGIASFLISLLNRWMY